MGRVMVDSLLSAHRGQMPDAAWQQRVDEWTPEVSARGWARVITDRSPQVLPGSARPRDRGSLPRAAASELGKANGSVTHVGQVGVDATRTAVPLDRMRALREGPRDIRGGELHRLAAGVQLPARIDALSPTFSPSRSRIACLSWSAICR
jgi:hypothetical protein